MFSSQYETGSNFAACRRPCKQDLPVERFSSGNLNQTTDLQIKSTDSFLQQKTYIDMKLHEITQIGHPVRNTNTFSRVHFILGEIPWSVHDCVTRYRWGFTLESLPTLIITVLDSYWIVCFPLTWFLSRSVRMAASSPRLGGEWDEVRQVPREFLQCWEQQHM